MPLTVAALLLVVSCVGAVGPNDASTLVQSRVDPASIDVASPTDQAAVLASTGSNEVDVSSLVSKPEAVFDMMGKQVGSLEEEMKKVHERNRVAIANQQHTYEAKLAEQRKQNGDIRLQNEGLVADINKLTATNRQLWQRGKDLQQDNDRQRDAVRNMQAKIADAADFAAGQMKELADLDHPEELVLKELDALDLAHQDDAIHKQHLDMIAGLGKANEKVAMLSVGDGKSDPTSILKIMEEGLAHLDKEQRASEEELRAIFAEKFAAEAREHKQLVDENESLTSKKAVLTGMFDRLTLAVKHLEEVRDGLHHAILSLGAFSQKVGKDSLDAQGVEDKKVALADQGGQPMKLGAAVGTADAGTGAQRGWLSRTWTHLTKGS